MMLVSYSINNSIAINSLNIYIINQEQQKNQMDRIIIKQEKHPSELLRQDITDRIAALSADKTLQPLTKVHFVHFQTKSPLKVLAVVLLTLVSICIVASNSDTVFKLFEDQKIAQKDRVLQQYSKMQEAPLSVKIDSRDNLPRWLHLDPQKGTQLEYNALNAIPPQQSMQNQQSLQSKQFDADFIIFQNNKHLAFEIVANITGEKLQFASKLLDISHRKTEYDTFIYEYQRNYYEKRYEVSKYQELPMCIIVPTFNNARNQRYKHNLDSIMAQQYTNYRVIIIDDASEDGTATLISDMITNNRLSSDQFVLIKNPVRMRALSNIRYAAITHCKPQEIMMIIDGDDQLVGKQVFKLFNAVFQKEKAWFAYSNFIDFMSRTVGYSRPFPDITFVTQNYRHQMFSTSHLRAFYTSLFLKVKEEDLKNEGGKYFQAANDIAICMPILEMSAERVKYVPEITYGYNSNTGNNNHVLRLFQQQANDRFIRSKQRYQRLDTI